MSAQITKRSTNYRRSAHRLARSRTPAFHADNRGSNPLGDAIEIKALHQECNPADHILPPKDINLLTEATRAHGGHISSKVNPDGSTSPYELNISYFNLLNDPDCGESMQVQVNRFLVSQAIPLAMAGIPGIYMHSLLGSQNYTRGVAQTGHPRTINREKLQMQQVAAELNDPASLRHAVFQGYQQLLQQRITHLAFHPNGKQRILRLNEAVFSLLRTAPNGSQSIVALHNVSPKAQTIVLDPAGWGLSNRGTFTNVLTGQTYTLEYDAQMSLTLTPYQVAWLIWLPEGEHSNDQSDNP